MINKNFHHEKNLAQSLVKLFKSSDYDEETSWNNYKNNWSMFYELSPLRKNIFNWGVFDHEKACNVLEIGSNSGIFIKHFNTDNTVAVEPCSNFAKRTNDMDYVTYDNFWNIEMSKVIKQNHLVLDSKITLVKSIEEASNFVGEFIPVKNHENNKYIGSINESDLFQAYLKLQNQVLHVEKDTDS